VVAFNFGGLPLERGAIQFFWLMVDGGRAARSVEKQVDSLLNGMTRRRKPARLTSDLHGGCGPKLTHGFNETPLAGRGTVPTVRHHQ